VLFSHGRNEACLVPDSCRATVRNGNSISGDSQSTPLKNIRTTPGSFIFRQSGSRFGLFDIVG
jgi:hypothetical protein